MNPAKRARLTSDICKWSTRLERLAELAPLLTDRLAHYGGMVAAGDLRRGQGALALIEQNLRCNEISEPQAVYAIGCLDSSASETNTARLLVVTLRLAVAGLATERAKHTASIAAAELALKAGA